MDDSEDFDELAPNQANEGAWLTSYSDMMTILLVFFVMLISASKISSVKFERIKEAFSGHDTIVEQLSIEKMLQEMQNKVETEKLHELVDVVASDNSVEVILKDKLLFDLGKVTIKDENRPILDGIVELFRGLPDYARIAIEGYTDDNPVKDQELKSNWHLSVYRALSVLEVFDAKDLCFANCEVRGFGEFRPSSKNRDEKGQVIATNQAKNRRVVIQIY